MNFHHLATQLPPPESARVLKEQSAGEFVHQIALAVQAWLDDAKTSGADKGKRWILSAAFANGESIVVRRLSAHGQSMVRVEGQRSNGAPCLLLAHQHSFQLLAFYVEREPQEPPRREIGFHTGIEEIKIPQ